MANSPQAIKRARQNDRRRLHNASLRSAMRTEIKKVLKLLVAREKDLAYAQFKLMTSSVDKLVNKGLVHKNKAARIKSRVNARLKATFSA